MESFPNCVVTWRRGSQVQGASRFQRRLAKEQGAASVYQVIILSGLAGLTAAGPGRPAMTP
jgi:hypothetical protein